ncbi:MAG: UDP-N-acetylenolpyruvoylglucosamine reductase [Dehalococcoidaceae bacterium]|nr:UDP-N-acetylenolpyruvoylglucosamine reductase [Dehalococcoidaceae bacterium]
MNYHIIMSYFNHPTLSSHSCILEEESLNKYSYMNIGGNAKWLAKIASVDDLSNIINWSDEHNIKTKIIGAGSNILIDDAGWNGLIIIFRDSMNTIRLDGNNIIAESGAMLPKLSKFAQQNELTGLEFAIGIPGSLGGALYSNAGINDGSQIGDIVKQVTVFRNNQLINLNSKQITFNYRHSSLKDNNELIISAVLTLKTIEKKLIDDKMNKLIQYRKTTQPLASKNAGSMFKNTEKRSAGELIESCDLKGQQIGGAMVSHKHANFIENVRDAKAKDVVSLMTLIQSTVFEKTGFFLEPEVEWISDKMIPEIFNNSK